MKKKVLIIDDETSTLEMLGDFLRDDYDVTVADDLLAGTQRLLGQPFDVLILDVRLPGKAAYDELQALINGGRFANLPVLLLSADRAAPELFVAGPRRAFLPKPVRPAALQSALEQLSAQRIP